MTNDLISRSALLAEYDRVHVGEPGGARKLIEEAPAVDAEPVLHAKWIAHDVKPWDEAAVTKYYTCASCGRIATSEEPYCHCGAKMDGGASHD